MRIAMGVEYDGSEFRGWQIQDYEVRTVQGCLEQALAKVADSPVKTICAGRTDAGVHAIGQVVHFDTEAQRSERSWILGSNANLPSDISVLWARPISDRFHARFSVLARRYRYVILNRPYRSALQRRRAAWCHKPLHVARMIEAAQHLLGEHDFTSFRAIGCQAKNPVRVLQLLTVEKCGDFIVFEVEANAFLYHMVRNIVGVLMAIGSGEQPPQWARDVLEKRNRACGGVTAPVQGLYLTGVRYADKFAIPASG
jgi:tRNA pseudouridine38-40 synthase